MRMRDVVASALGIVFAAGLGCANVGWPGTDSQADELTEQDLRQELVAYSSQFSAVVGNAGDRIREETTDPRIRKRVLLWQIRLVPAVQEAAFLPNPKEAFVAVNGLVVGMRQQLTVGEAARAFGDQQPIAIAAAHRLEDDFYVVAAMLMDPDAVAALRAQYDVYDAGRFISGSNFEVANVQEQMRSARDSGEFDAVIGLPLAPFRALEGVGSGAAAVYDFNITAQKFAGIVEAMPQQLRWESELLLYSVEERETTIRSVEAVEAFAESSLRLAAAADRLPRDLEATLAGSRATLVEANRALETARGIVGPIQSTVEQLSLASEAWAPLFARDGVPDPDARPFDIREYEATARQVGESAAELRAVIEQLGSLVDSPAWSAVLGGLDVAVARAESGGRDLVDHAAWRAAQLMLALFALLLVYRVIVSRLDARAV